MVQKLLGGSEVRLTKDEAVRLHREMWGWLTENPEKRKCDWPRWKACGGDIRGVFELCFACQVSSNCAKCLLVWPNRSCYDEDALFYRWELAGTNEKAKLAKQIRDLPVRAASAQRSGNQICSRAIKK